MKILHASDARNETGILRTGLLASLASGKRPAVWAVAPNMVDYAINHCCIRRGIPASRVVVFEINVPRSWVRRFSAGGVYYIPRDIPPERIRVCGRVKLVRE